MAEEDLSNTTIRRFDITRLIARGGMGEVYLAKDAVLGRDLALKILRQDVTRDSDRLERFVTGGASRIGTESSASHRYLRHRRELTQARRGTRRAAGALHRDGAGVRARRSVPRWKGIGWASNARSSSSPRWPMRSTRRMQPA